MAGIGNPAANEQSPIESAPSDHALPHPDALEWRSYLPGALLSAGICLGFALLWWNRFFAVTNEWHFFYADQIVQGKIPYRDFYLFVPPLLHLEMAATIKLFGERLIASQILALLEICILSVALFSWMARVFRPAEAFFSSVTGIVILLCYRSEALNAVHTAAITHMTVAGWVTALAIGKKRLRLRFAFFGGVLAGMALLIKQTEGMAAVLSLPVLLALISYRLEGIGRMLRVLGVFVIGCFLPLAAVGLWLQRNYALRNAFVDIFLQGPASKGSLSQMLTRSVNFISHEAYLGRHAALAVLILIVFLMLCRKNLSCLTRNKLLPQTHLSSLAVLIAATIFMGWALAYRWTLHVPGTLLNLPHDTASLLGQFGSYALFLLYFWLFLENRLGSDQLGYFFLAGFCSAAAFLSAMSWPTAVGTVIPAFSFVLASILTGLRDHSGAKTLRSVTISLCLLGVVQLTWRKCASPYEWSGWKEPDVHHVAAKMPYPELADYHVSSPTAQFVIRVTSEIDAHSSASQPIFVYPDLPVLYLLSHRQPATFGYVHFIDVAPDFIDIADAETLRQRPPAVLVIFKQTEEELRMGELYFRGGHPSGQRNLLAAVAAIRPDYDLLDSITTPITHRTVEVLVRKTSQPRM